jgi:DNA-binding XRE family transcriptional regulator
MGIEDHGSGRDRPRALRDTDRSSAGTAARLRQEDTENASSRTGAGKVESEKPDLRPFSELAAKWRRDPAFLAAEKDIEWEWLLALEVAAARARSGLTQEEIARRMGTTQSAVARLESGRSKPSMRTLERYAAATGSKVRVVLEAAE